MKYKSVPFWPSAAFICQNSHGMCEFWQLLLVFFEIALFFTWFMFMWLMCMWCSDCLSLVLSIGKSERPPFSGYGREPGVSGCQVTTTTSLLFLCFYIVFAFVWISLSPWFITTTKCWKWTCQILQHMAKWLNSVYKSHLTFEKWKLIKSFDNHKLSQKSLGNCSGYCL